MVKVSITVSKWDGLSPFIPQIQERGMNLTALDLIRELHTRSPVDHGLLRQWFVKSKSKDKIIIKSPAKYVGFQNYGTKAHFFAPKTKKALHWEGGGYSTSFASGIVKGSSKGAFSKGHWIKAMPGKRFVENSIMAVKPRIDAHFKVAIQEVLK